MREGNIRKLKDFFFEAVCAQLNDNTEPEIMPSFFGSIGYTYTIEKNDGIYCYQDMRFDTKKGRHYGIRTIEVNDQCVWIMHYHGACLDRYAKGTKNAKLMNFIKKVRLNAYEKKEFFGVGLKEGIIEYMNVRSGSSDFKEFQGREEIVLDGISFSVPLIFCCDYEGGLVG